jgi:hypothetical protein
MGRRSYERDWLNGREDAEHQGLPRADLGTRLLVVLIVSVNSPFIACAAARLSTRSSYRVILDGVKTAISIPDETFNEAERYAAELGISRSEFFTTAARHYIQELDAESLTGRIDAALVLVGDDESSHAAVRAGRRALADGDDW